MTALMPVLRGERCENGGDRHPRIGSFARHPGLTAAFASEATEGVAQPSEYTFNLPFNLSNQPRTAPQSCNVRMLSSRDLPLWKSHRETSHKTFRNSSFEVGASRP